MDNGYRAITSGLLKSGDECRFKGDYPWGKVQSNFDDPDYEKYEYQRPIAQDHYATPTEKVVEHALDATANAPDEWEDGFPPVGFQLVSEIAIGWLFDNHRETYKGFYDRIDETQSQIEERERYEVVGEWTMLVARTCGEEFSMTEAYMAIYDWLKSTDQLKDKSDD